MSVQSAVKIYVFVCSIDARDECEAVMQPKTALTNAYVYQTTLKKILCTLFKKVRSSERIKQRLLWF